MGADTGDDWLPYWFGVVLGRQVLAVGGGTTDTTPVMMMSEGRTMSIELRGTSRGAGGKGETGEGGDGGPRI